MSKYGQLMEHAPFCERDIRVPENLKAIDQKGDFDQNPEKGLVV